MPLETGWISSRIRHGKLVSDFNRLPQFVRLSVEAPSEQVDFCPRRSRPPALRMYWGSSSRRHPGRNRWAISRRKMFYKRTSSDPIIRPYSPKTTGHTRVERSVRQSLKGSCTFHRDKHRGKDELWQEKNPLDANDDESDEGDRFPWLITL